MLPSGFFARTRGVLQGDSDSEITPFLRFSSMNSLIFSRSSGEWDRGLILIGFASPVSIWKGSRFAGRPISRKRSGHLRLIHRRIFRGSLVGCLVSFLSGVESGGACGGETLCRSMRYRDVDLSTKDLKSSGEVIRMEGLGLAGQRK